MPAAMQLLKFTTESRPRRHQSEAARCRRSQYMQVQNKQNSGTAVPTCRLHAVQLQQPRGGPYSADMGGHVPSEGSQRSPAFFKHVSIARAHSGQPASKPTKMSQSSGNYHSCQKPDRLSPPTWSSPAQWCQTSCSSLFSGAPASG